MATCPNISQNVLLNCLNPLVSGVNDRLILIPFDVWESLNKTFNTSTTPPVITAIAPGSPAPGYVYEGKNNSIEPRKALVKLRYTTPYDHEIRFKVFVNSPEVKDQLERLPNKKVVAIVQYNYKGTNGNAAFEVYGADVGLELQENESLPADVELGGAYDMLLRNSEFARPGTLPHTIFNTDFAATKAIVDSLVSVPA